MAKIEASHSYTPKSMAEMIEIFNWLKAKKEVRHVTISATYTEGDPVEHFGVSWLEDNEVPGAVAPK